MSVAYEIPPRLWAVIGQDGVVEFAATRPEVCHEHINDACGQRVEGAGKWVVREYVLPHTAERSRAIMEMRLD